jgi:hypothetical protein
VHRWRRSSTNWSFSAPRRRSPSNIFFCYLSVRTLAAAKPEVLKTMDDTPLFWSTTHHAMLRSAFVALGRIFDQDKRSNP